MVLILPTGENVLLDDADFRRICKFVAKMSPQADPAKWQATYCTTEATPSIYASKTIGGRSGKKWRLHRLIFYLRGLDIEGKEIDHEDGDGLNNCWTNLRLATSGQNKTNRGVRADSKSGYKGVEQIPSGRYAAYFTDGVKIHLGMFDTPELAAAAYNEAAYKKWGPYARFNVLKRP